MLMTPEEQIEVISKHMGPKFEKNRINAKIICFDHNFDDNNVNYAEKVLSDEGARKYLNGSAFHPYCQCSHSKMTKVHNLFPEKGVWFTGK
jgi:glucosylceramidase